MTAERKQAEEILDMYWDDPINVKYECALRAMESYAPLRVAEATKEMYQFVEWIGANANMLYYPNSRDKWLLSRIVMSENPSVEYDEYTTAELFEYWKQNIRK